MKNTVSQILLFCFIIEVKADISNLNGIHTLLKEDGYHYDKPKIPFSLPPSSVKNPLCSNGAPDSAYPDCCKNNGKGKYCCTNGSNVPGCQDLPVKKKEEYLPPP
ncbi:hypothetical protein ACKWTF_002297 [Chironomus riparius]